ncbi:hypothetical protein GCM10010234_50160 [Streptomyces hawaiiensis]
MRGGQRRRGQEGSGRHGGDADGPEEPSLTGAVCHLEYSSSSAYRVPADAEIGACVVRLVRVRRLLVRFGLGNVYVNIHWRDVYTVRISGVKDSFRTEIRARCAAREARGR